MRPRLALGVDTWLSSLWWSVHLCISGWCTFLYACYLNRSADKREKPPVDFSSIILQTYCTAQGTAVWEPRGPRSTPR